MTTTRTLPFLYRALSLAVFGVSPAVAVTITVTTTSDVIADDGQCSLREAVIAANEDFPSGSQPGECPAGNAADEIVLGSAGTYALTIPGTGEDAAATGDLDITESVDITGGNAATYVIDGNFLDRVIHIFSTAGSVTIGDLTIRRGSPPSFDDGGGIYNDSSLSLQNVVVRGNSAGGGGGIYNDNGSLTLIGSSVIDNFASNRGGGVRHGFSAGALLIDHSLITNNEATFDGGGINAGEPFTITNSLIALNVSGADGGGVANPGGTGSLIAESTISGNSASDDGGGISTFFADLTVRNVTLSGNAASDVGGGIAASDNLDLNNVTLAGNTASAGSAVWSDDDVAASNTIFAGSCEGSSVTSSGGNIESPGNTCDLTHATDQSGVPAGQLALGPLADNGGPTLTHHPDDGSVAIEGGLDSVCEIEDQRGVSRPQNGDQSGAAICDVGAVEVIPCPFQETLVLQNDTITGTETFSACSQILAGPNLFVATGAVATFRAGDAVTLRVGFSVDDGGELAIEVDPLIGQLP